MKAIKLDSDIYPMEYIEAAKGAYKEIACIECRQIDERYVECTFSKCIYDKLQTSKEFCNYLIDLMNKGICS